VTRSEWVGWLIEPEVQESSKRFFLIATVEPLSDVADPRVT